MVSKKDSIILKAAHKAYTKSSKLPKPTDGGNGEGKEVKASKAPIAIAKKEKKQKIPKSKPKNRRMRLRSNKRERLLLDMMKEQHVPQIKSDESESESNEESPKSVAFTEEENEENEEKGEKTVDDKESTEGEEPKNVDESKGEKQPLKSILNKKGSKKAAEEKKNVVAKPDKHQWAALGYLKTFCKNKDEWKFKKVLQMWILRNLWFSNQIDDKHFKYALKYLKDLGDHAKRETTREARELTSRKIYNESDDIPDAQIAVTKEVYKRAEAVIELFEKVDRKRK